MKAPTVVVVTIEKAAVNAANAFYNVNK